MISKAMVIDVTEKDFHELVLDESRARPVLVDFWASWCGPCKTLGPILEKLALEFDGAFLVARVDTEANPGLSTQFQVRSIPLVILFQDESPQDQFVGVLPEDEIRAFLRRYCPAEADCLVQSGKNHLAAGEMSEAGRFFEKVLMEEPAHPGALLGMARIAADTNDTDDMQSFLERIPAYSDEAQEVEGLKVLAKMRNLRSKFGGADECRQQVDENPEDQEARFRLACCLAGEAEYEEALEILLALVAEDRRFRDDGARKVMVEIFELVGVRSSLADGYRARLSRTIF